jgi:hypothetical protein
VIGSDLEVTFRLDLLGQCIGDGLVKLQTRI